MRNTDLEELHIIHITVRAHQLGRDDAQKKYTAHVNLHAYDDASAFSSTVGSSRMRVMKYWAMG
jgi:hypothetical protein